MKMELIQPFINAADAVLSQGLHGTTKVVNLTMEEQAYRRKGVAGMVAVSGDIEGRIVLDLEALNDQGFHFRVHPPLLVTSAEGDKTSEDTEALMICFETPMGNVFMNVALRQNRRRVTDHAAVGA